MEMAHATVFLQPQGLIRNKLVFISLNSFRLQPLLEWCLPSWPSWHSPLLKKCRELRIEDKSEWSLSHAGLVERCQVKKAAAGQLAENSEVKVNPLHCSGVPPVDPKVFAIDFNFHVSFGPFFVGLVGGSMCAGSGLSF